MYCDNINAIYEMKLNDCQYIKKKYMYFKSPCNITISMLTVLTWTMNKKSLYRSN